MKRLLPYLFVPVFLLCAVSCARNGRMIPKSTLVDIYSDMLAADQMLMRSSIELRREVDTTLFYDPIFHKYGYNFNDYNKTRDYYINHPDKYAKLFIKVAGVLSERKNHYRKLADKDAAVKEKLKNGVNFDDKAVWKRINILWPETPDTLEVGYYVTRKDGFWADNESSSGEVSGHQFIARERQEL